MNSVLAAEWKYADGRTSIHIHIADVDVALILLLIPMSELVDTEIQMRALGRRAIIGSRVFHEKVWMDMVGVIPRRGVARLYEFSLEQGQLCRPFIQRLQVYELVNQSYPNKYRMAIFVLWLQLKGLQKLLSVESESSSCYP